MVDNKTKYKLLPTEEARSGLERTEMEVRFLWMYLVILETKIFTVKGTHIKWKVKFELKIGTHLCTYLMYPFPNSSSWKSLKATISQDLASKYQVAGIQVLTLVFFLHLHTAFGNPPQSPVLQSSYKLKQKVTVCGWRSQRTEDGPARAAINKGEKLWRATEGEP